MGGFRGQTSGVFATPIKMLAVDFRGANASLSIQKSFRLLNGFLQLRERGFILSLVFAPFREERQLGGALTSGTLLVRGDIRTS